MHSRPKFPNKNRFEYQRMTGAELKQAMDRLGWTESTFAGLFGQTPKRVKDYVEDRERIPVWVPVVLHVLETVPGALGAARGEADRRILVDHHHERYLQRISEKGEADV